jgi:hypothetical protein
MITETGLARIPKALNVWQRLAPAEQRAMDGSDKHLSANASVEAAQSPEPPPTDTVDA